MPRLDKVAGHRSSIRMCLPLALKRHVMRDRIRPAGLGRASLRRMLRLRSFALCLLAWWLLWPFSLDGYGRAMFPHPNALKSTDTSLFGVSLTKDPMPPGSGEAMSPPTLSPFPQTSLVRNSVKAPKPPLVFQHAVALSIRESLLPPPRYRFRQSLLSSSLGRPF